MSETKKRGRKKAYPKIWETVLEQANGDKAKALKEYHRYRALADVQGLDGDADVDDVKEPEATAPTEQGQARPRGRPKGSTNKKRGRPKGSVSGSGAGRRGRPPGRSRKEAAAAAADDGAPESDDEEADEPQHEHKAKKAAVTGRMPEKDLYEQLLAAKEAELRAEREAKEAQRLRAEAEKRRADDLKELAMTYARGQKPQDAAAAADDDGDGAGEGDGTDDVEKQPVDLHKSASEGQKQPRQFFADNTSVEKRQPDELRTKKKHDKPAGKKSSRPAEEGSTPAETAAAQSPAKSARGAKP